MTSKFRGPESILGLDPIDGSCVGLTKLKQRCTKPINKFDLDLANVVIGEMDKVNTLRDAAPYLKRLASLTLCKEWHNSARPNRHSYNQIDITVRRWKKSIEQAETKYKQEVEIDTKASCDGSELSEHEAENNTMERVKRRDMYDDKELDKTESPFNTTARPNTLIREGLLTPSATPSAPKDDLRITNDSPSRLPLTRQPRNADSEDTLDNDPKPVGVKEESTSELDFHAMEDQSRTDVEKAGSFGHVMITPPRRYRSYLLQSQTYGAITPPKTPQTLSSYTSSAFGSRSLLSTPATELSYSTVTPVLMAQISSRKLPAEDAEDVTIESKDPAVETKEVPAKVEDVIDMTSLTRESGDETTNPSGGCFPMFSLRRWTEKFRTKIETFRSSKR